MLEKTRETLQHGLETGLHIGAQTVITHNGQTLLDEAIGLARLPNSDNASPATLMTPHTLMLWLSAGKPVTALAITILVERHKLHWHDPIASHIPEFAANGKAPITLHHILTHTAGFRALDTQYPFLTWDETLAKLYALKLERDWIPGQKAGYHAHSSWYILGELIRRLDSRPVDQFVREEIFLPLRMPDTWMALAPHAYEAYGPRIGFLHDTTTHPPKPIPNYDSQLAASRPRPSASIRGPMRDLARFYNALLNGGENLISPATLQLLTTPQRIGMFDETFRQTIDWGLGFIMNSSQYGSAIPYQFGPHASPAAFGHGGSQSSVGMADPTHNLVIAAVFNGSPGEPAHDKRLRSFLRAVYEDLDLAPAN